MVEGEGNGVVVVWDAAASCRAKRVEWRFCIFFFS